MELLVNRRPGRGNQEWATPQPLFDALDREFRFTLDAAATLETRKCERYLTIEEDALRTDVFDQVVFCNPPYAGLGPWVVRFARWAESGCTVVALLPACTDTIWFNDVWRFASEVRLLAGRVSFVGSKGGNPQGSMVAVYRPGRCSAPPRVSLWNWRAEVDLP